MLKQTFAAFAVAVFTSTGAVAETLTDAFVSAYKTSNLLVQNRALLRAADEDVVQSRAALLPVIGFVTQASFRSPATGSFGVKIDNWSGAMALNLSLTLYDNGVTRYSTDAAKETVLGLRAALLQVEQQVLFSTVQSYMEMIRAAQAVSLGQNNVRLITQELRAARDRFEVGEVTRTDVAIAEARLAAARGNLAANLGDLEVARESYKAVVGRYPGNLRWPSSPPMTARSEDAVKAIAVRNHPSLEEAQRQVNVSEANVLRARAAMGPNVTTSLRGQVDDSFDKDFSANLTLNVPIYQGGARRSVLYQAIARRDAARSNLLQAVVQIKQNAGVAWSNLSVAVAQTEASRRQVRASQVAYNGVREEATLGSRTTLDVLNAEQELLDARSTLIAAEVQQYVSVYALLASMGLLTAEHLNLGVVIYDPAEYYRFTTTRDPLRVLSPQGKRLDGVLRALRRDN
ncbi:MAG: TolC family outer membrane protein [Rhodobacter sp.]|nr:TolC family outer membrane protein [Rhodobacter sp.]